MALQSYVLHPFSKWRYEVFFGLQILIFTASGLQIPTNITPGLSISICNAPYFGLQILIFAASGLQIPTNITPFIDSLNNHPRSVVRADLQSARTEYKHLQCALFRITNPDLHCVGIANPDEHYPPGLSISICNAPYFGLQILIFTASGLQIPTNLFCFTAKKNCSFL